MNYKRKILKASPVIKISLSLIPILAIMIMLAFTVTGCSSAEENSKGFKVSGTKLLDSNGNEFIIRGINHAHNWYKSTDTTAITAISKTGANSVRIVLSNGELYSKDSIATLKKLISLCEENKLIAILEIHDTTGSNNINSLVKAAEYWIEMKDALLGHEDTVILNIANEWYAAWDSNKWAEGYMKVIPMKEMQV